MQWVSVKDRLPIHSKPYVVKVPDFNYYGYIAAYPYLYKGEVCWENVDYAQDITRFVTEWLDDPNNIPNDWNEEDGEYVDYPLGVLTDNR